MMELFKKLVIFGIILSGIVYGSLEYRLLPKLTNGIRKAQLVLIQESKASKWGRPVDLYKE